MKLAPNTRRILSDYSNVAGILSLFVAVLSLNFGASRSCRLPESSSASIQVAKNEVAPGVSLSAYGTDWGYTDYGTDWDYSDYGGTIDEQTSPTPKYDTWDGWDFESDPYTPKYDTWDPTDPSDNGKSQTD